MSRGGRVAHLNPNKRENNNNKTVINILLFVIQNRKGKKLPRLYNESKLDPIYIIISSIIFSNNNGFYFNKIKFIFFKVFL